MGPKYSNPEASENSKIEQDAGDPQLKLKDSTRSLSMRSFNSE